VVAFKGIGGDINFGGKKKEGWGTEGERIKGKKENSNTGEKPPQSTSKQFNREQNLTQDLVYLGGQPVEISSTIASILTGGSRILKCSKKTSGSKASSSQRRGHILAVKKSDR